MFVRGSVGQNLSSSFPWKEKKERDGSEKNRRGCHKLDGGEIRIGGKN